MTTNSTSLDTSFLNLVPQLIEKLKEVLPGASAHQRMESDYRRKLDGTVQLNDPKQSAVLFLLYPDESGETCAAFILRQSNLSIHSNQISLPGGRTEESDRSFEETALRETHEEIGVEPQNVTIIGKLTEVLIPRSGFLVHPYVGFAAERPTFKLQIEEVADLYEVKLADLFHHETKSTHHITDAQGNRYTAPSYLIAGRHLWGATAMMMAEVEEILNPRY
ncbi:MAG: NUDIX hydrolase [Bacteroidales bacterium]